MIKRVSAFGGCPSFPVPRRRQGRPGASTSIARSTCRAAAMKVTCGVGRPIPLPGREAGPPRCRSEPWSRGCRALGAGRWVAQTAAGVGCSIGATARSAAVRVRRMLLSAQRSPYTRSRSDLPRSGSWRWVGVGWLALGRWALGRWALGGRQGRPRGKRRRGYHFWALSRWHPRRQACRSLHYTGRGCRAAVDLAAAGR